MASVQEVFSAPSSGPTTPRTAMKNAASKAQEAANKAQDILGKMEEFANAFGAQQKEMLGKSLSVLENAQQYSEAHAELERLKAQSQRDLAEVQSQLLQLSQTLDASEVKHAHLFHELEKKKEELEAKDKAIEGWRKTFMETMTDLQTKTEDHEVQTALASNLQKQVDEKETTILDQAGKIRDREAENGALNAQNQALQSNVELFRKEKEQWEQIAAQQKSYLLEKQNQIAKLGEQLQGLEGRVASNDQELNQVQTQVKKSSPTQRISRLAIAILIGIGITLAVALLFFLKPHLATATGALLGRIWSLMPGKG